jgi:hypothetical protein
MDLIGKALQKLRQAGRPIGEAFLNAEKQNPLYGQLQAGIRESVAPIMANFVSKQGVDRYKSFSQPNKAGIPGAVAKFVGEQVPYVPLMLATEGMVGPYTSKIASRIPQGANAIQSAMAGAVKGGVKFAPYGWTGGLEKADNADERFNNIVTGIAKNAGAGAVLGAGGGLVKHGMDKLMLGNSRDVPPPSPSMQQVRDVMGRFTNQKVPAQYSPARGRLYNKSTVRGSF